MFHNIIYFVILWLKLYQVLCKPSIETMDEKPTTCMPATSILNTNETKPESVQMNGDNHFHATHQTFYLIGHSPCQKSAELTMPENSCSCSEGRGMRPQVVSLKLHMQTLTWDEARKTCIDDGGHLAVIRTDNEEKIVLQMMTDKAVDIAWLGLHDRFEEGVWISIFDEPLHQIGWSKWSTRFSPNPATSHCATLVKNGGGMTDNECAVKIPFVCKSTIT